jgi:ribA/ribD-fused uncharacterized protein
MELAPGTTPKDELNSRVYFSIKTGHILSNMHSGALMYWGIPFRSAEHAYQWAKCKWLGRTELARQVSEAETPFLAKTYARTRLTRQEKKAWRNSPVHLQAMYSVLLCRYHSEEMFRKVLDMFSNCYFCEDTHDKYWGIGCSQSVANALSIEQVPGENVLGRLLMLLARTKGEIIPGNDWEEFCFNLDYDVLRMM